jgi:predicted polyphosphate/ATP-dependent NAD kinase
MKKKLGLIVNPIAGMGGRVALKGTDGQDILRRASALGAQPEAPARTVHALKRLRLAKEPFALITYPHEMGEREALESGLSPVVMGNIRRGQTSALDTKRAASDLLQQGIDLLLFAGGDGTARDICSVIGDRVPALGIPCGVKIHSAVYGTTPRRAGDLAARYMDQVSPDIRLAEGEVMDIDEESFRENRLSARLYGYMRVPYVRTMIQCAKAGDCAGGKEALDAIAADVIDQMEAETIYIIGTGTTAKAVMARLGIAYTLLGVDAVCNGRLVGSDMNEGQLLQLVEGTPAKIVVGVIGRQGYIFGRGNQQISAEVIRKVGKNNITVLATMDKITSLKGALLLVDTGDERMDESLTGYTRVICGYRERTVLRVTA